MHGAVQMQQQDRYVSNCIVAEIRVRKSLASTCICRKPFTCAFRPTWFVIPTVMMIVDDHAQGRRKQIESGGAHFRREAPENFFFGPPHFSFGPPHFNSIKLKWGGTKDKWGP